VGAGFVKGGSMSMTFIKPVFAGDRLTVHGLVKERRPEHGPTRVVVGVWGEKQDGDKTAGGTATGPPDRAIDSAHPTVETNGMRMHVAEAGQGPLVLLCHGFPESWHSWRHQLAGLARAGYHAVAPDQRGYGQTDAPQPIEQYTLLHLVGDVVGLVAALGDKTAVIVGHDWGAPVAWHAALLRPDVFRAVAALSVPFIPRRPARPTTVTPPTPEAP